MPEPSASRARFDWLAFLYALVAGLLVTHEIDGAYFQEWRLFGLGLGIQGYVWLNLALVMAVLWGLVAVVKGRQWGTYMSLLLAATGIAAFFIHLFFNMTGHPGFDTVASWAVLGLTLALSPWLAVVATRRLMGVARPGSPAHP